MSSTKYYRTIVCAIGRIYANYQIKYAGLGDTVYLLRTNVVQNELAVESGAAIFHHTKIAVQEDRASKSSFDAGQVQQQFLGPIGELEDLFQ